MKNKFEREKRRDKRTEKDKERVKRMQREICKIKKKVWSDMNEL